MKDTDEVLDPTNQRKIKDVFTGNRWFMKLHHTGRGKITGPWPRLIHRRGDAGERWRYRLETNWDVGG